MLSNKTVTAIREMLATFNRAEIPSLVMKAGGKRERLLSIPVVGDMNSPQYKAKSEILNEAFDSLYSDFNQEAVERILLELVRVMMCKPQGIVQAKGRERIALETALEQDGLKLEEIVAAPQQVEVADAIATENETDDRLPLFRRKIFDRDPPAFFEKHSIKNQPLSLLMLDLDRFKAINDTHGRPIGDEVLMDCARIVHERVEGKGKAYRYGG